jgi:hypothetical protein
VHYNAVYHQWPVRDKEDGRVKVKKALLSISPLLDESDLGADSISESITATYEMYVRDGIQTADVLKELVVAYTLDNCSVNQCTVRTVDGIMIGAYCHRLNLAASHWTQDAYGGRVQDCLDRIHAVMKRASTLKVAAQVRKTTARRPKLRNKTRWTGNQDMAVTYDHMHTHFENSRQFDRVTDNDTEDIEDGITEGVKKVPPKLLGTVEKRDFDDHYLPCLDELRRWFKHIQNRELTMKAANDLFHSAQTSRRLSGQSLEFERGLDPNHSLVKYPDFEKGVVKIMSGKSESMSLSEQRACAPLLRLNWPALYEPEEEAALDCEDVDSPSKFGKMMAAGSKRSHHETVLRSQYVDCSFLSPTTVVVESLFSKGGKVMTADRKNMMPRLFEAIVFLLENDDWWDIDLVQEMVTGLWKERLRIYNYDDADEEYEGDW